MKRILFYVTLVLILAVAFYSCQKEPTASFIVSNSSAVVDENITFTNTSIDAYSYEWQFGDGQMSSEASPIHSYSQSGTYTVTLTVESKNGNKTSSTSQTIYVSGVGDCIFWMSEGDYYVYVTLNGTTETINYNVASAPYCGSDRGANFSNLKPGTYNFYATDNDSYWNSTITIYENECTQMRLYYAKSQKLDEKGKLTLKLIE